MRSREELHRLSLVQKSLKSRIEELTALYEISKSITSSVNLNRMLGLIAHKVASILKADVCTIHLLDKSELRPRTMHTKYKSIISRFKKPISMKNGLMARAARVKKILRLDNISKYAKDAFCNIYKKAAVKSLLMVPLVEKGVVVGVLTCCSRKPSAYTKEDEKELTLFASQAAIAIENARLFDEIKINYLNTMKMLASVIDAKDAYTEDHSERVMRSSIAIAKMLRLTERQKSIIKYASLLHDIGKIGIDISTLRKPGPLTPGEWAEMKKHPEIGAEIIKKAGFLDDLIPTIRYHHVKYSGGGYPVTRMKKDKIPIEARILAVADAYEAMRSNRPYRKRLSKKEAIHQLKKGMGTQFDPKMVGKFLKYLKKYNNNH